LTAFWLALFAAWRIAGVVVNAASGQPVAGARVSIESSELRRSAISGDDGRFAFADLPPGRYELVGQRRGLLSEQWPGAVVAGPEQDTGNIVLRLTPPAVISGKVTDDEGDPAAQARVELIASKIVEGRRKLRTIAVTQTDDAGEYRVSALRPGGYYIAVSAVPWYAKFIETMGDNAPASMTHSGFATRFYPNVKEPAAAEPLLLQAGQEGTANFTLQAVPASAVHVHCEQYEDLTKHYTLMSPGLPGSPVSAREGSESGFTYNFWAVAPGHYTIKAEASDGRRTWYGVSEFDVAEGDADVSLTLEQAPSLSGRVTLEGEGALPPQLALRFDDERGESHSLAVDAKGRFSAPAILPGRYRVSLSGAGDDYLKAWPGEGGRRVGELLEIPPGAALKLTPVVAKGGRVAGTVYRDGTPVPGALVVAVPAYRAVVAASDGSYEFRGLAPGDCGLFAVEGGPDLEYANPEAIRPYMERAKRVRVSGDGANHVRLEAIETR